MRITPLDIRKQEFKKSMRGFDPDEVNAFLGTVADEYEAALSDNKRLREHIVDLRERLKQFQNMETNLRNTLLTAEKLTAEAKENARREAGLIVREAEAEAEKAAEGIRAHTMQLRREILELKKQKDNYLTRFKTLIESHRDMIDGFEDDFKQADMEIEELEARIEKDSKEAAQHHRMSRDRITEEFSHNQPDSPAEQEHEMRKEDYQAGSGMFPGADRMPEAASAPKMKNDESAGASGEMTSPAGEYSPEGSVEQAAPQSQGPADIKVPIGEIDANHVEVEDDAVEEIDPGDLQRKVVENIEHSLYPEVEVEENGEEASTTAETAQDQTERPRGDRLDKWTDSVVGSEPQGQDKPAAPDMPQGGEIEEKRDDQWDSYEIDEKKTDWSQYEIPKTGSGEAEGKRAGDAPVEAEVEEALAGLTDEDDSDVEGSSEGEIAYRQPRRGMAPQNGEGETVPGKAGPVDAENGKNDDSNWSIDNLRKNLTNINDNSS